MGAGSNLTEDCQEHGRWDEGKGKEDQENPQELLELVLFRRRMLLEPPEQIKLTRKGEGKGW